MRFTPPFAILNRFVEDRCAKGKSYGVVFSVLLTKLFSGPMVSQLLKKFHRVKIFQRVFPGTIAYDLAGLSLCFRKRIQVQLLQKLPFQPANIPPALLVLQQNVGSADTLVHDVFNLFEG